MAASEESWHGLEITKKYSLPVNILKNVHAYQRIEEAVAGLKEGGTEVEGMIKKLEMGEAAVAASKNKVG